MALSRVFFDTSVLIGGLVEMGAAAAECHRALDAVAAGRVANPATAWHCCLETFSVLTRLPQEYRVEPPDALRLVEEEVIGRFDVLALPEGRRRDLLRRAVLDGATGGRIYDAHLGEIALAAGCTAVVTENLRHFRALERHGVEVLAAAELTRRLA